MSLNVDAFHWRRSSRCTGGNCAEAAADAEFIYLRDSTQAVLRFDQPAWRDFLAGLKADSFGEQAAPGR